MELKVYISYTGSKRFVVTEGGVAVAQGGYPRGHRKSLLRILEKKLYFRANRANQYSAKLTEKEFKIISWSLNGSGKSGISVEDLKKTSKMSSSKIYDFFEPRMILETLEKGR